LTGDGAREREERKASQLKSPHPPLSKGGRGGDYCQIYYLLRLPLYRKRLPELLDFLGQGGDDLEKVIDNPVVRLLENGGFGIFVDGHHDL
jgi:hypothetical protein